MRGMKIRYVIFNLAALVICTWPGQVCAEAGQGSSSTAGEQRTIAMEKVVPREFNGDVRKLPLGLAKPAQAASRQPGIHPVLRLNGQFEKDLLLPGVFVTESASATAIIPLAPMPDPIQNFPGMNFNDACTGGQCGSGWPPDTNGEVGQNHYIQAVNGSYAIYTKATGSLLASFTEDALWSTSGANPCNGHSQGDPIVVYDRIADRWILTHFAWTSGTAGPFYECIAVSKTDDPVSGGWWFYPVRMDPGGAGLPPAGTMNDYPKFGMWTDCLYMSANEFTGGASFAGTVYASFSRSDMYNGAALTWSLGYINNSSTPFSMIPSNMLGTAETGSLPPSGTPNYFVSESTTAWAFEVRKFTAGPNCGAGGTLSAPVNVSQTSYSPFTTVDIVPQPNTTVVLDVVDDRLMQKVQYRNINGTESLWVVHNVKPSGRSVVGMQWAQIDVTGGTISASPVQQQIYAPDNTLNRWMGSLAVDKQGNMALGYSTSGSSAPNFPSIAYAGRLVTDPTGTLPQTEKQIIAGSGSQTINNYSRWGDYSAMSLDPVDECTFWYTNEYYSSQANGTSGNWQTRIASFKFPSCGADVPGAPTIGIATPGNQRAVVSFSTPTYNGGSPITVYTATSNPDNITGTGSTSPITVNGLANGTAYTFTVTATNSAGTGSASEPSNSVTPATTVPDPPTGITAVAGNTQATVSFSAPLNNGGSAILGYTATSNPGNKSVTGLATSLTVTGLTNGTSYTFTVTATSSLGTSTVSAVSNSVIPATLPGAPAIGTATAGSGQATVTFSAPSSNGGSAVTTYTVTSHPGGITATGSASPITVTGLANATAYSFTVTAKNIVGTGPSSAATNTVTPYPDGDLTGNGSVGAEDALKALKFAAGLLTPTTADLVHGDVAPLVNGKPDPDGRIDIGDVVVILRKSVGLVSW